MNFAADFRKMARDALNERWKTAVLVGLIAILLGAVEGIDAKIKIHVNFPKADLRLSFAGQTIFSTGGSAHSGVYAWILGNTVFLMIVVLIIAALYLVLGGIVSVGYARFNLNLVDGFDASFADLFAYFPYWKNAVCTRILTKIYIFLWSFLFVIPGIVASFSYAMTDYILAEHPELSASEAIYRSKQMMEGNRWRLFCLELSFIGWNILCAFTFGLGHLFLIPYKQAAIAAFYREVSGTEYRRGYNTNSYYQEME